MMILEYTNLHLLNKYREIFKHDLSSSISNDFGKPQIFNNAIFKNLPGKSSYFMKAHNKYFFFLSSQYFLVCKNEIS